eukprot:snap_masked-scaffold_40-processed-gene-2.14-mRNA-1 protein AED:1.00 eAED:1.00 QI:0/0/0/0/1/1/2/0/61
MFHNFKDLTLEHVFTIILLLTNRKEFKLNFLTVTDSWLIMARVGTMSLTQLCSTGFMSGNI